MSNQKFHEPKRAKRIRDSLRMQAKAERVVAQRHPLQSPSVSWLGEWVDRYGNHRDGTHTWDDVFARRSLEAKVCRDNLALCSCPMCGNPRRHFGIHSFQEAKANDTAYDQFQEQGIAHVKPRWRFW
jgi:hypothetical protein